MDRLRWADDGMMDGFILPMQDAMQAMGGRG